MKSGRDFISRIKTQCLDQKNKNETELHVFQETLIAQKACIKNRDFARWQLFETIFCKRAGQ